MVATLVLGTSVERRAGSSPALGTIAIFICMKKDNKMIDGLADRHVAWIIYHKMGTKIKPSKKVYKRAHFKKRAND